jgi:hypothetical protein
MVLVKKWYAKHPEWFERSFVEIELRYDGWTPLIDDVLNAAEKIMATHPHASFRVDQIKEKLGGLRIYVHQEGLPEEVSAQLSEISLAACQRSFKVCEICGAPAALGSLKSRWSVRCQSCAPVGWEPSGSGEF